MFIHSLNEPDDINKQKKKLTRMLFVVIPKESMISGKDHTPKGITKKVWDQSFLNLLRILHDFISQTSMKPLQDAF